MECTQQAGPVGRPVRDGMARRPVRLQNSDLEHATRNAHGTSVGFSFKVVCKPAQACLKLHLGHGQDR